MRILFLIVLLGGLFLLNGCATPSNPDTMKHINPINNIVQNELSVEESIEDVWYKVILIMDDPFFDVKNVDEKQHIIRFSFYSEKPCNYADCGVDSIKSEITIPGYNQGMREYEVRTCENTNYRYQTSKVKSFGDPYIHEVITNDIYTNIVGNGVLELEPRPDGTSIVVNVNYQLRLRVERDVETFDAYGKSAGSKHDTITDECNFTTLNGKVCNKFQEIRCNSTGVFEKTLLELFELN